MPFWGGFVTTKELMKHHVGFDESRCDGEYELLACSTGNHLYIIDLHKRKLLQILETR